VLWFPNWKTSCVFLTAKLCCFSLRFCRFWMLKVRDLCLISIIWLDISLLIRSEFYCFIQNRICYGFHHHHEMFCFFREGSLIFFSFHLKIRYFRNFWSHSCGLLSSLLNQVLQNYTKLILNVNNVDISRQILLKEQFVKNFVLVIFP